jgi:alpha-maltose-1-phosphate synthase
MLFKKLKNSEKRVSRYKPRLALLRANGLEKRNVREIELLSDYFDIVAFGTPASTEDRKAITLPIKELKIKEIDYPQCEPGVFRPFRDYMVGLEKELKGFDLVFTADTFYAMSHQAIESKKRYGIKVVVLQNENIPFNFNHDGSNYIHSTVLKNVDHFVAISNFAKETLMLEGIPQEKITVIGWGIDTNGFDKVSESAKINFMERYNISTDSLNILFVGRLDWSKGIFDIIYAAKKILLDIELKNKRIKFIFIGDGPDKEILKRQIKLLNIEKDFCFCGKVPLSEIEIPYSIADILLAPSIATPTIREQFGQVLIEGMAAGLPIITTYTGAMPEIVGDYAILIPPSDYVSLARELKRLIENQNLREELGRKAKNRAMEKFDLEKVSLMLKNTLEMVLKTK